MPGTIPHLMNRQKPASHPVPHDAEQAEVDDHTAPERPSARLPQIPCPHHQLLAATRRELNGQHLARTLREQEVQQKHDIEGRRPQLIEHIELAGGRVVYRTRRDIECRETDDPVAAPRERCMMSQKLTPSNTRFTISSTSLKPKV
mgnify:CR=1 FL=1